MQVFKSKTFKRILSVIVLVLMLIGAYEMITKNLENYTYGIDFSKDLKEIEKSGEPVDIVFMGASRLHRSMVPEIFEEKLSLDNVLVASTSFQPISGSYYYIKQMIKDVHPKKIILDVTWDRMLNPKQSQALLLVYDRLSGFNKIDFALNCFDKENRRYLLGPCRYRDNLSVLETVREEKKNLIELGYNPNSPTADLYQSKGFVDSIGGNTTGSITYDSSENFDYYDALILEENKEYLDKCIEICKENNVEIELVTAPCSVTYMYYVDGYDDAVNWYKEYAKEKGVKYINLNYLIWREEFLPDEYMADLVHTTGKGAKIISEKYAELLLKESMGEDISSYFYENLDEFKKDVHRIVALEAQIEYAGNADADGNITATVHLSSLKNPDANAYYQIELQVDGSEEITILSEFSQEETVSLNLPGYTGYKLIVRAKSQYEGDKEAKMIYSY